MGLTVLGFAWVRVPAFKLQLGPGSIYPHPVGFWHHYFGPVRLTKGISVFAETPTELSPGSPSRSFSPKNIFFHWILCASIFQHIKYFII